LATHMPSSSIGALLPGAWSENDRIRKLSSAKLVRAAIDAGAQTFVQESFAPVYPDNGDDWIDETMPIAPARYNRTVAAAEREANWFIKNGARYNPAFRRLLRPRCAAGRRHGPICQKRMGALARPSRIIHLAGRA